MVLWIFAIIGMACVATSGGFALMALLVIFRDRRAKRRVNRLIGPVSKSSMLLATQAEEASICRARQMLNS